MPEWVSVGGGWDEAVLPPMSTLEPSTDMNEHVYVDNTTVNINARGVVLQNDVYNYAGKFFRNNEAMAEIFFPGLRWRSRDGLAYLIERPPEVLEIFFTPTKASQAAGYNEQIISLPIPWTVWLFTADVAVPKKSIIETSVWARPSQITSLDDPLYCLPLPNMDTIGRCCAGESLYDYEKAANGASLVESFSTWINSFWNSGFNLDMRDSMYDLIPNFPGTKTPQQWLDYWSSLSLSQALELDFRPSRVNTVKSAIASREAAPSVSYSPAQLLMRFR